MPDQWLVAGSAVDELEIGRTRRVAVAQLPLRVADDARRVAAIAVPVADDDEITGLAVSERDVGDAVGVAVAQAPGRALHDAGRVGAVAVPVARDRAIRNQGRNTIHNRNVATAQPVGPNGSTLAPICSCSVAIDRTHRAKITEMINPMKKL